MAKHYDQYNAHSQHPVHPPQGHKELPVGEGSHKLSAYELPCTEVDKQRRNFVGWQSSDTNPALMDAISYEGTTETRGGASMNPAYTHGEHRKRSFN